MCTQPTRSAEEVSRFTVLYAEPRGTVKQRQFRDGVLSVSFHTATLRDAEDQHCVAICRGSGLLPNELYRSMLHCHCTKDLFWHEGSEVHLGRYLIRIETVLQLHCVPYKVGAQIMDTEHTASFVTAEQVKEQTAGRTATSPLRRTPQQLADLLQQNYAHCL